MIVKSFLLRPERATSIAALCPAGTIAVIRPESRIEGLFRDAIRAAIVEKNPSGAPYDAIRAYFDSFSGDAAYRRIVEDTLHGLSSYLGEGMYVQTSAAAIEDYVMAKCTRLCAEAVASRLGAPLVGGTQLMICHEGGARPFVDWTLSRAQISQRLAGQELVVVPGGYGRLDSGYVVRIGRGGAHLMASLIASATAADCVEYYVEEDGIAGLPAMSYDEAAHYCASSAAPFPSAALWPAKRDSIPIKVLNICNPDFPGTVISEAGSPSGSVVSGVLCDSGLELLTVYGTGLLGQIGMSSAVFSAESMRPGRRQRPLHRSDLVGIQHQFRSRRLRQGQGRRSRKFAGREQSAYAAGRRHGPGQLRRHTDRVRRQDEESPRRVGQGI